MIEICSDSSVKTEMRSIDETILKIIKNLGVLKGSTPFRQYYEYNGNGTGITIRHAEGSTSAVYNSVEFHGKQVYFRNGGNMFYNVKIDKSEEWKEQLRAIVPIENKQTIDEPRYDKTTVDLASTQIVYN